MRRDVPGHIFPDGAFHHHDAGKFIRALFNLDNGGDGHILRQGIGGGEGKSLPFHLVPDPRQLPLLPGFVSFQFVALDQPTHYVLHVGIRAYV